MSIFLSKGRCDSTFNTIEAAENLIVSFSFFQGLIDDIDPCPSLWKRNLVYKDYADTDKDNVADVCDNCLYTANTKQVIIIHIRIDESNIP